MCCGEIACNACVYLTMMVKLRANDKLGTTLVALYVEVCIGKFPLTPAERVSTGEGFNLMYCMLFFVCVFLTFLFRKWFSVVMILHGFSTVLIVKHRMPFGHKYLYTPHQVLVL